jgi:hypothetical protein
MTIKNDRIVQQERPADSKRPGGQPQATAKQEEAQRARPMDVGHSIAVYTRF